MLYNTCYINTFIFERSDKVPRQRITREIILDVAFKLARGGGSEQVVVKNVADEIGCSVQPVYSYFANMEALKEAVLGEAMKFYNEFIYSRVEKESLLESMARANVAFAKYETNIFKLLFLQKLNGLNSFNDIYEWMGDKQATAQLAGKLSLSEEKVKEVYIMLIIFTHGVATMIATGGANISDGESAAVLEKAYRAFIKAQE